MIDRRAIELIRQIAEMANDNEKMMSSALTKFVVDEAVEVNKILQGHIEPVPVDIVAVSGFYVVDRNNPEDEKWEGLKEIEVFKSMGQELIQLGAFERTQGSMDNETERFDYKIQVIKPKK